MSKDLFFESYSLWEVLSRRKRKTSFVHSRESYPENSSRKSNLQSFSRWRVDAAYLCFCRRWSSRWSESSRSISYAEREVSAEQNCNSSDYYQLGCISSESRNQVQCRTCKLGNHWLHESLSGKRSSWLSAAPGFHESFPWVRIQGSYSTDQGFALFEKVQ